MDELNPIVTATCLSGSAIGLIFYARHRDQLSRDTTRAVYQLGLPADLTTDSVTAVARSMTALRPPTGSLLGRDSVVFEIVRRNNETWYRLRVGTSQQEKVLAHLRGLAPGLRADRLENPVLPALGWVRELRLTTMAVPLRTEQAPAFANSLLHALGTAGDREALVYQLVVHSLGTLPVLPTTQERGPSIGPRWLQDAIRAVPRRQTGDNHFARLQHRAKLSEPLFGLSIRVGAQAASQARGWQLVRHVVGTLHQLDRPGTTFITRRLPQKLVRARIQRAATSISHAPVHANAREVATLMAWLGDRTAPGLQAAVGRPFRPAREIPTDGYVLGTATYPGMERPVAISPADALMHTLVAGPTGSGKSTVLLGRLKQAADRGESVVLIDPNGDLATDFINCLPPERVSDLIYLNPADDHAVPLNPLACALEDAELVADQVLELIRERSDSWGVQIDETLKATLVLLAASPGMTLTEIPPVLLNDAFRAHLLTELDPVFRPTVGEFFARYDTRSVPQQAQDAAAVLNKVSPLLDRRPIRAMLGQAQQSWSMRSVLDDHKLLVVALPSGVIGPVAADLIGGMVAQMVWNAALGRITVDQADRRPVSLVIDELPRFVRGSIGLTDVLARSRAQGIGLTTAVQHLGQVQPPLRLALLSEARNKIVHQPGADDAATFARHMPGVTAEDLLGLPPRTALASLVTGGRVSSPVTVALAPPPKATGCGDAARAGSRRRYGQTRRSVEQAIQERRRRYTQGRPRRTRRLP